MNVSSSTIKSHSYLKLHIITTQPVLQQNVYIVMLLKYILPSSNIDKLYDIFRPNKIIQPFTPCSSGQLSVGGFVSLVNKQYATFASVQN